MALRNEIMIRPAKSSDAEAAVKIVRGSITELCVADHQNDPLVLDSWLDNKTPVAFRRWLQNREQRYFLALIAGDICGLGGCSSDGEIMLNYIDPAFRFRGISAALLEHMETELKCLGVVEAKLTSTQTALRFYQGRGWSAAGKPGGKQDAAGQPMSKIL